MIIIPLFDIEKQLYENLSKFFIKISNNFLIEYCLKSIKFDNNEKILFILSEKTCFNLNIDVILKNIYKNSIFSIIKNSNSVLDSIIQSKHLIFSNEKLIIFAPPFSYFEPQFEITNYDENKSNIHVLLFKSNNPQHCYTNIENNKIIDIKEKSIIGNYALLGIYCFKDKDFLLNLLNTVEISDKALFLSDLLINYIRNNNYISFKKLDLIYPFKNKDYIDYLKKNVIFSNELIIGLSSDHSGFEQKNKMIEILKDNSIKYIDYGCYTCNDCDYYDFIKNQYEGFKNNEFNFALSFCRSGQGVNICANHCGFISTLIYNKWSAQMAIQHNNCNCMCLSGKLLDDGVYDYLDILNIIKNVKFLGGRFLDRLIKVKNKF